MGVYIKPCRGCPLREGCTDREELRRKACGIGAQSVRFACAKLASQVRPGRRITINTPVARWGSYYGEPEHAVSRESVSATIHTVRSDYSFGAVVDREAMEAIAAQPNVVKEQWTSEEIEKRRFRRVQPHSRIVMFLDEPDRGRCEAGQIKRADGSCDMRGGCECHNIADLMSNL